MFLTQRECQEHVQFCLARSSLASADTGSQSGESADMEVLSETESETSLTSDLSEPGGERGQFRNNGSLTPTSPMPLSKSPAAARRGRGGARRGGHPSRTPPGTKRGSVSSTGSVGSRRRTRSGSSGGAGSDMFQNFELDQSRDFGASKAEFLEYSWEIGSEMSDEEDDNGSGDGQYRPETTRLLSLIEEDMLYSDEEDEEEEEGDETEEGGGRIENGYGGRVAGEVEEGRKKSAQVHNEVVKEKARRGQNRARQKKDGSPLAQKPEPVGVFWDIENCRVPPNRSAFALANKMRAVFFKGKREAEFMCVCDITKESKEVIDALHKAQVSQLQSRTWWLQA